MDKQNHPEMDKKYRQKATYTGTCACELEKSSEKNGNSVVKLNSLRV